MNWQDDLALAEAREVAVARGRILRNACLWTPIFAAAALAFVFFFVDRLLLGGDHGGTWFLAGFLALLSFLFGFQAAQALLDLTGGAHEATAIVTRRWSRSDSLVMRSHYVRFEDARILRVGGEFFDSIKVGDRLRVRFFPHSAVAIWVEKLPPAASATVPETAPERA